MKINFFLHRRWLQNYKVKLFSLLSAFFLWFYVITDNYFEYTVDVPLRIINKPIGKILTKPLPQKVKVLFRGLGKSFLSFRYRNKRIELDLHQVKEVSTFSLNLDMIKGIPAGMPVTPLRIVEPESITVRLDRSIEKKVAIHLDIQMVPTDGYTQIGDISFEPDSLILSGPESMVNAVSEVFTEKKVYRNVIKEIRGKVSIVPPSLKILNYSQNTVRFKADIQRIGERIITEIPVNVYNIPQGIKVSAVPSTLSLKLQGGVKVLSKLKREEIFATIDFKSRHRYRRKGIPATIELPKDISFSDVKPKFFELVVER